MDNQNGQVNGQGTVVAPVVAPQPIQPAPTATVSVSLSKSEERSLSLLRPEMRAAARADMLESKRAAKIAYLNDPKTKERLARDAESRSKFSTKYNPQTKTLSTYGLGRRFPVALYKGEWLKLIENIETIKAEVAKMPE